MINTTSIRLGFMQLLTQDRPLQDILDYTESLLGMPVLLQDGTMFTLGTSSGYDASWPRDFSMIILEDRSEQERLCADFESSISANGSVKILDYPHMPGRTILLGIFVSQQLSAILRITEKNIPLEQLDPDLIQLLREVYSLVARVYASTQVESIPDRALKRLLLGTMNDPDSIANCHVFSQISNYSHYQLIVFHPDGNAYLRMELQNLLHTEWVTLCGEHLCALLFSNQNTDLFSAGDQQQLEHFAVKHHLSICIGDIHHDLTQTYNSFSMIRTALASATLPPGCVVPFDSLKLSLMLSCLRLQDNISFLFSNAINRIMAYDQENNSDYLLTLRTYAACDKNAGLAAQQLYIHKNTLLYRIQRIRECFSLDLDNPDVWLHVCITLRLLN